MFPPDELWLGSDTNKNRAVMFNLYIDVSLMRCLLDGERGSL